MILVVYTLDVLLDKQKEFLQAVPRILSIAAQQPGCLRHRISRDIDDDHSFYVFQEWENQAALDVHWQSNRFAAFLGRLTLIETSAFYSNSRRFIYCRDRGSQCSQSQIEESEHRPK